MASVARFGFEGGNVPSNVSIISASYRPSTRAVGGTCVESIATGSISTINVGQVVVSTIDTNAIYYSCQMKRSNANSDVSMSLVQFGNTWVTYEPASSRVTFRKGKVAPPGYDILFTSPTTVNFAVGTWFPVSGRFTISNSTGIISITIDGTSYDATSLDTSTTLSTKQLYFGLGHRPGDTDVGCPTFQLDDVAVNNPYSGSNSTGSFGVSDTNTPPFIVAKLVNYTSTGSNTFGWNNPSGNITGSIVNTGSNGEYITSSFFPRPVLELVPSNSLSAASSVEGINFYYSSSYREGSNNVFLSPNFKLNPSSSVGAYSGLPINSFPSTNSFSVFEKDLGGKITYSEFLAGNIMLNSSQFINTNFFGRGTLGDVKITSSVSLGSGNKQSEPIVLEYNNLILDSGVTMTVSGSTKALFIYVKENCIINGTINMNGPSPGTANSLSTSGSFGAFILDKNTTTSSQFEYSASLHQAGSVALEQSYQPFLVGSSVEFGLSSSLASGGAGGANAVGGSGSPGSQRGCGGGGAGGGRSLTSYAGGNGGSAGTFVGGSGGGGTISGGPGGAAGANGGIPGAIGAQGGWGGGVVYLIVGKTLTINSSGAITANGSNGTSSGNANGGGGGGGGGSVNIVYGKNIINNGTVTASAGAGGSSTNKNGGPGGVGSVTVTKILSN